MRTIGTIEQCGCTYTIDQMGNCSFRISFHRDGENRIHHVDKIYSTEEECREYIRSCGSMDALIDLTYNDRYQRKNIKRIVVKINQKTQPEILEHLNGIDNVQGYIIDLIKNDMNK